MALVDFYGDYSFVMAPSLSEQFTGDAVRKALDE